MFNFQSSQHWLCQEGCEWQRRNMGGITSRQWFVLWEERDKEGRKRAVKWRELDLTQALKEKTTTSSSLTIQRKWQHTDSLQSAAFSSVHLAHRGISFHFPVAVRESTRIHMTQASPHVCLNERAAPRRGFREGSTLFLESLKHRKVEFHLFSSVWFSELGHL